MRLFFLLNFILSLSTAAELCFVRVKSVVRRDVVAVLPSVSQIDCNVKCFETPGCEACMFYTDQGNCVMLTSPHAPIPGQCPMPYYCYEKRTTGCPVRAETDPSTGYTNGSCSRATDVIGSPRPGDTPVCRYYPQGRRRIVLDAIRHDGSRIVFENFNAATVIQWDASMGSWAYNMQGRLYYFASAACVRVPASSSTCCGTLPTEPALPGLTADSPALRRLETAPICPNRVQLHYARATDPGGDIFMVESGDRSVYCALGVWMNLLDGTSLYNEYTVVAATCLTYPNAG